MLKFKSVKQKLLLGFAIVIVLVIGLGTYNFFSVTSVNEKSEKMVDKELPFLISDARISYNIANRLALSRAYILYDGNPDYRERFNKYSEDSKIYEDQIMAKSTNQSFKDKVQDAREWNDIVIREVFDVYKRDGKKAAMQSLVDHVEPQARELMSFFDDATKDREAAITATGNDVINSGNVNVTTVIVVTILVTLISIVVALVTGRMIADPIKRVMERMKLLAEGDLSQEALESNSEDEVGHLVGAANEMNENLRDLLTQISAVSERVSSQSEELTQSATEVKSGSEQIATTMQELAVGSESQANRSSELSALMTNFAGKISDTNENGEKIKLASEDVVSLTEEGSTLMQASTEQMIKIDHIVREAVEKVEGLDAQSQEITQLVSVIKDIAEQTNLLALNAAIEAARAGEHGKGFAVVADEVRKLAEQVAVSVTNITDIVTSIQSETALVSESLQTGYKEVEQGTAQVRTTGETFAGINNALTAMVKSIQTVSDNLADIAGDSNQMNSSIQEIAAVSEESAAGIEQTSATSQQSTSSMEEVAESSTELARMAEQLNGLVQRFKL